MKKNYTNILSLILIGSISLLGCKKTEEDLTESIETAESFSQDQPLIMSTVDMIDDFLGNQNFSQKNGNPIIPNSAAIDYIDTTFTDNDGIEIDVDFGDLEILCGDNFRRSGKFKITCDKPFKENGAIMKLSLIESSSISKVSSSIYLLQRFPHNFNLTRVDENKFEFVYKFTGRLDFGTQNAVGEFSGNYIIAKIEGQNTPEFTDDKYNISGNGEGTSRKAIEYQVTIKEDLIKSNCSKLFTKGVLVLKNKVNKNDMTIDFGDGTCDSKLKVTYKKITKEINL